MWRDSEFIEKMAFTCRASPRFFTVIGAEAGLAAKVEHFGRSRDRNMSRPTDR